MDTITLELQARNARATWLRGVIARRIAAFRAARRQSAEISRTFGELNRLDERELADLGLCRADIGRVARESVTVQAAA